MSKRTKQGVAEMEKKSNKYNVGWSNISDIYFQYIYFVNGVQNNFKKKYSLRSVFVQGWAETYQPTTKHAYKLKAICRLSASTRLSSTINHFLRHLLCQLSWNVTHRRMLFWQESNIVSKTTWGWHIDLKPCHAVPKTSSRWYTTAALWETGDDQIAECRNAVNNYVKAI